MIVEIFAMIAAIFLFGLIIFQLLLALGFPYGKQPGAELMKFYQKNYESQVLYQLLF